jgi:ribosome-binding factor A
MPAKPITKKKSSASARRLAKEPSGGARTSRVAAQLRQAIARLIARDLADPRLADLVVSSASITSDLRVAKIAFRIATTDTGKALDARRKDAEKALEKASGRLRKAVTSQLGLRVAPELRFVYDEGQDARDRIEQLLHEIQSDEK